MPETTMTIRLVPDTGDLAQALEIIAKHARACADELRAVRLTAPSMDYDAAAIADSVREQVTG
jgi:hypothetical protein